MLGIFGSDLYNCVRTECLLCWLGCIDSRRKPCRMRRLPDTCPGTRTPSAETQGAARWVSTAGSWTAAGSTLRLYLQETVNKASKRLACVPDALTCRHAKLICCKPQRREWTIIYSIGSWVETSGGGNLLRDGGSSSFRCAICMQPQISFLLCIKYNSATPRVFVLRVGRVGRQARVAGGSWEFSAPVTVMRAIPTPDTHRTAPHRGRLDLGRQQAPRGKG